MVPAAEEDLLKLTAKQRLYVENRLAGMNQTQSAIAAGASPVTAPDMERHPRVQRIMLSATKAAMERITMDRQDVLQGFMDAVNSAQSATELVMAWREIGKVIGAYEPEVKIVQHQQLTAERVRNLKDEELLKLADMEDFAPPALEGDFEEVTDDRSDTPEDAAL